MSAEKRVFAIDESGSVIPARTNEELLMRVSYIADTINKIQNTVQAQIAKGQSPAHALFAADRIMIEVNRTLQTWAIWSALQIISMDDEESTDV